MEDGEQRKHRRETTDDVVEDRKQPQVFEIAVHEIASRLL
jgi:hypothetical protein